MRCVLSLLLLLSLGACGGGSDEDATAKEGDGNAEGTSDPKPDPATPIVAVLLADYQEGVGPSLRRRGGELGVNVLIREAQGRPAAQWKQYEALVAQGVTAVVLQPASQAVLQDAREDAKKRELELTLVEQADLDTPVVLSDTFSSFLRAADRWSKDREAAGPVRTLLAYDPGWPDRRDRLESVLDHLEKRGLVLDVVQEVNLPALAADTEIGAEDREQRKKRVLRALQSAAPIELVLASGPSETSMIFDALEGETEAPSVIGISQQSSVLDQVRADPHRFQVVIPRSLEVARSALEVAVKRLREEAFDARTEIPTDLSGAGTSP